MARKRIGLALGAGAARGLCQIGILKVLSRAGIKIDYIAGTSVGSMVGAGYAVTGDTEGLMNIALATDWKKLFSLVDLRVPVRGIIEGHRIEEFVDYALAGAHFAHTKVPLAITAADVLTSEEVIMTEGSIAKAVRASISLPILFKPFHYNGRCLIDGATVDPVPVRLVRQMGADYVIAVNTYADLKGYFDRSEFSRQRFYPFPGEMLFHPHTASETNVHLGLIRRMMHTPSIIKATVRTIGIMERHLALPQLLEADVVINPDVGHIGSTEYTKAKECIELGEAAARDCLDKIGQNC